MLPPSRFLIYLSSDAVVSVQWVEATVDHFVALELPRMGATVLSRSVVKIRLSSG